MKRLVTSLLAGFAAKVVRRQKPFVVAITGSVGKSSAKQAIAAVLNDTFRLRASPKSYNSEIGVPLTVLDLPNGGRSPFAWLEILSAGWSRSAFGIKDYPEVLVLEMAADHPGDLKKLTAIAPPQIAVVTAVGEAHLAFFGTADDIEKEKRTLIGALDERGIAVLNADDERVLRMKSAAKGKVVTYGFSEAADLRGSQAAARVMIGEQADCRMGVTLSYRTETARVELVGVLGMHSLYAALAAAAVAVAKGIPLAEIAARLSDYDAPPGRMRCLTGIKRTLLVDDTYNASPKAVVAALGAIKDLSRSSQIGEAKRIVVLGDMLELGANAPLLHEEIGRAVVDAGADLFVAVGELMGDAARAAVADGMPQDRVYHFSTTDEAGRFVQERMKMGDVVLIKGSQGMRMERVTKELMADPLHAEMLLCRQGQEWE